MHAFKPSNMYLTRKLYFYIHPKNTELLILSFNNGRFNKFSKKKIVENISVYTLFITRETRDTSKVRYGMKESELEGARVGSGFLSGVFTGTVL